MSDDLSRPSLFERRITVIFAVLAGVLLAVGWLIDINERFGTMLGSSLTAIASILLGPAVLLIYWVGLRQGTSQLGLIAVMLAALGAITMAGAISMPVVARAAGEQARELMEGRTYTILGLTAFILLLVGFTVSAVLMYRSPQVSKWIAILVGVGPIVAMAGGPTEIHQLTASGFVLLGVGVMAAGLQLRSRATVAVKKPHSV